jgi:hypothetical protein
VDDPESLVPLTRLPTPCTTLVEEILLLNEDNYHSQILHGYSIEHLKVCSFRIVYGFCVSVSGFMARQTCHFRMISE